MDWQRVIRRVSPSRSDFLLRRPIMRAKNESAMRPFRAITAFFVLLMTDINQISLLGGHGPSNLTAAAYPL
jgi:hypothetical protein